MNVGQAFKRLKSDLMKSETDSDIAVNGVSLNQIDVRLPLDICPTQYDLDVPVTMSVATVEPIILMGKDVALFLEWAQQETWRAQLELELQSVTNDSKGRKLYTTWIPLVTFRENFCANGRQIQDPATQALMDRLRLASREWRDAGVDTVELSGRACDFVS